jgi:hypothetical protein
VSDAGALRDALRLELSKRGEYPDREGVEFGEVKRTDGNPTIFQSEHKLDIPSEAVKFSNHQCSSCGSTVSDGLFQHGAGFPA